MKKLIVLVLCAVLISVSGCHKTPSTTIINNNSEIYEPSETETPIDEDNLPVVTLTEESVDEILECGDVTVTLKGTVSKPDILDGLCTYKAEIINYNEYEQNMTFLFGEYEDLVERNEISKHLYYNDGEQWGYSAYLVNSSMYEEENFTGRWGSIFYNRWGKPLEEKTEVGMTNEEAKVKADEIIERIGLTSFEYYYTNYYDEVLNLTMEGTLGSPFGDQLSVIYTQNLQGVPVLSMGFQREAPHARVTFDYDGVLGVSVAEYTYEVYSQTDNLLTYEEALERFKSTIQGDKECDGLVFDQVKFEYAIIKVYVDGNFETIAVPYWHFYFEGIPGAAVVGVDVLINAIDGSAKRC